MSLWRDIEDPRFFATVKSGDESIDYIMDDRQSNLLNLVVETYIKTAEPVGSRFLVENSRLNWSEATVRNELRALEEAGLLTHPHTSAGRIPTTKGYRYYLAHQDVGAAEISKQHEHILEKSFTNVKELETACKNLAKALVEISGETVIVAFTAEKIYYTGLSNLFGKPDFAEMQMIASTSRIFDHCEEYLPSFYTQVSTEPKYYLGNDHPFGELLSVLAVRFGKNDESLVALLGPQRMNYKRNWALMKKIKDLI